MSKVILENIKTGETQVVGASGTLPPGWRVKGIERGTLGAALDRVRHEREARVAVWATKLGLPVPQFLDAARWLLKEDCPFCQMGTQILRRVNELGEEQTRALVARILAAKDADDLAELEKIRTEFQNDY